jgi:hypothetical protein
MTPTDFRATLTRLGLTQTGFAREVERLGGERLPLRTVQDWCAGARGIPPTVPALLALLERAGVVGREVGKRGRKLRHSSD